MANLQLDIPSSISAKQNALQGSLQISSPGNLQISRICLTFKKTVQLVDKKGELENHSHNLGKMEWKGRVPVTAEKDFVWEFALPIHIVSPQNIPLKEGGRLGQILQRLETKLTAEYPSHQVLVEVTLANEEQIRQTKSIQVRY